MNEDISLNEKQKDNSSNKKDEENTVIVENETINYERNKKNIVKVIVALLMLFLYLFILTIWFIIKIFGK